VREARFLPDGTSILYSASWNGEPLRIYQMKPGGPDAAPLPLPSANLLAVSPSSELAVALACETTHNGVCRGTLATASLAGGAPHEVAENVQDADYAAGGSSLAIVRDVAGGARLELPPGRVLRETGGHFSSPRVSPAQDAIALFEHPDRGDDRGHVALVDFHGKTRRLTKDWTSVRGLAWSKDGKEIWFTGADAGSARALWAVTLGGELRLLHRGPSDLTVLDVGKDGRLLLAENEQRWGALGSLRGAAERELSWLDRSVVSGIAPDGASILITEQSDSVGPDYASALRGLDGAPPIPVGSGWATSINLEKTRVLTRLPSPGAPLSIVTLPSGDVKTIASPALQCQRADFFPDGKRILVFANEPGHRLRLWVVDSETARWTPISEEGQIQSAVALSPDGRSVAGWGADHRLMLFPVGGGAPTPVAGAVLADAPLAFVDGGRALVVSTPQRTPRRLFRIDLATGTRTPWKELMPRDQAGAFDIINAFVAPEGGSYAYTYGRWLSDLYVVNGLR
jgi:dipeptidyl aminopeptidase/acylaminoacyl peptidase